MGETVTVACKWPAGIIMRAFKMEDYEVPVLGGGTRREQRAVAVGEPVNIAGPQVPFGGSPRTPIVGGYAITTGVPAEVANTWMEQNKNSDLVKNGLVMIHAKKEVAEGMARERAAVRSGIEGLDVTTRSENGRVVPNDPRWPARTNPNLSTVATDRREA